MNYPQTVKKTVDLLSDGDALPVSCRITAEGLIPALAPVKRASSVPSGVIYACRAEGVNRFFLCTPTTVYVSTVGLTYSTLNALSGSSPFLVEEINDGAANAAVINGANAVLHTGSSFKEFDYGANLSCGAMHCGRLFGADSTDGTKLCWSGEGGITDWTGGLHGSGYLNLDPARGDILDVLEYGEKLVLVRKYGLTVMSAYGAPENFKVIVTDTDTDEIYKGTSRVVGGRILFFTASGMKAYDGSEISAVAHAFADDISSPFYAVEYGGKYFLSCTSAKMGGRTVLCYDAGDGGCYFIKCRADAMCTADSVYVFDAVSSVGVYTLGEGNGFVYTSVFDFGTDRNKTVTEIYADCESADIEISNGRVTRTFNGVSGAIRPRMRGKSFTVKVSGGSRIKKLTATAEATIGI